MLNQTTYSDLMLDLATRHREIQHTAQQRGYLKIIVAADPVQKLVNLNNFYGKLKESFSGKRPFVLQMTYDTLHEDTGSDQVLAHRRGGFIVLKKAGGTEESRDQVLTETERVGYELMAAVCDFFRGPAGRRAGRVLARSSIAAEAVGPVADSFYGTRFEFDFTESATQALTFNPDNFQPII
jgi:hypothetical protein